MPKRGNKKKKPREKGGRGDANTVPIEVTVNDYANSDAPRKTAAVRVNMRSVVKEQVETFKEDDRSWDEKDDDEENALFGDRITEGGLKEVKENDEDASDYVEYPLDFWFLISEKIDPEDVGRFAAICRTTYYVVSTARFWFSLYKRCYSWAGNLPESLAYHNMDNIRGLKPAVIRSLFYMYTPFISRIHKEKPLSGHPAQLVGAKCVSQWMIQVGGSAKKNIYYFMFTKQIKRRQRSHSVHSSSELPQDSVVHVNPDEGCYLLEVYSNAVCLIPVVMGNHLHIGHLGLSLGFCAHRLHLTLGPAYLLSKMNHKHLPNSEMTQVTIEPVWDVRIYPWWHPKYKERLPKVDCDDEPF